jgi:hypothetical protein
MSAFLLNLANPTATATKEITPSAAEELLLMFQCAGWPALIFPLFCCLANVSHFSSQSISSHLTANLPTAFRLDREGPDPIDTAH